MELDTLLRLFLNHVGFRHMGTTMNMAFFKGFVLVLLTTITTCGAEIVVNDSEGALGNTHAPVVAEMKLSGREQRAVAEGRLTLVEVSGTAPSPRSELPAQLLSSNESAKAARLCWLMPPGPVGKRTFKIQVLRRAAHGGMNARPDAAGGQFDLSEAGKPILRYNYATIEPGDLITKVAPANRIYARARSDYIHPLCGLDGEPLTLDWPIDHPHHRGIYWAWPEVDWHSQRGDLHALQHVFARPVGKCTATSGSVFAQIEAENVWKWESGESLVHERAVIRAYRATDNARLIDLEFQFTALNEPVLLARRGTDKYGGLNIRLAKVLEQEIVFHTDPINAATVMAWAELNGRIGGATRNSSLVVLQHSSNPDYPGDWVKFPEIDWFQPTFPASGTRYELKQGRPLVLRFRLWLHRGAKASAKSCGAQWHAYNSPLAPNCLSAR